MGVTKKDVHAVLKKIREKHGKGSVSLLGDVKIEKIPYIPSGSLKIDWALGIGGFPRGRMIEIYGPEGCGKTTLALSVIAEAQRMGLVAAFIDAENALSLEWAQKCGIRMEDSKDEFGLILSQPDFGEQGLQIAEEFIGSGVAGICVVDSVAALVPKKELEGEIGDQHIGLQARMMSQALRMLSKKVSTTQCCLIFINQLREKIMLGGGGGQVWGDPTDTPGGRALKFWSSVRIDIRSRGKIKVGENIVATKALIRVAKNKVASPFKEIQTAIYFGQGIDLAGEIIDLGKEFGILSMGNDKRYRLKTQRGEHVLGHGREKARQFLLDNPGKMELLRKKVYSRLMS